MDNVLAVLAAVLLAVEFSFSKTYQAVEGIGAVAALRFNMMAGLLSALVMFAIGLCLIGTLLLL